MKLDKAAKQALELLAQTIPGGGIIYAAFDDDIEAVLTHLLSKRDLDEMREAARDIAEAIKSRTSPHLDRNPGAAVSAAHDFLNSVSDANITFSKLLDANFEYDVIYAHIASHRPGDWMMASNQRKGLWEEATSIYVSKLIEFHLSNIRSQGHMLQKILRTLSK